MQELYNGMFSSVAFIGQPTEYSFAGNTEVSTTDEVYTRAKFCKYKSRDAAAMKHYALLLQKQFQLKITESLTSLERKC